MGALVHQLAEDHAEQPGAEGRRGQPEGQALALAAPFSLEQIGIFHPRQFVPASALFVSFDPDGRNGVSGAIQVSAYYQMPGFGQNAGDFHDLGILLLPAGSVPAGTPAVRLPTAGYLEGVHLDLRERLGLYTVDVARERERSAAEVEAFLTAARERGLLEATGPDGAETREDRVVGLHRLLVAPRPRG